MKKLASITLSALLTATMVSSSLTMASATDNGTDLVTNATGSIVLYKYDSNYVEADTENGGVKLKDSSDKTKTVANYVVSGATFTAYRVLDLESTGYKVDEAFKNSGITVENLVDTSTNTYTSYGTYGTTDALEEQITMLQSYVNSYSGNTSLAKAESSYDESGGFYTIGETSASGSDEGLKPGVYLVVETKVPGENTPDDNTDDNWVVTTQSFLVAVPEWNQSKTYSTTSLKEETDSTENTTTHWNYTVTAYPKDESIEVDKVMAKADDESATTNEDSYEIGDTISYTVTADIPNYGMSADYPDKLTVTQNLAANYTDNDSTTDDNATGIAMYNNLGLAFKDTMSKGLMFKESKDSEGNYTSVTIKVGENTLKGTKYTNKSTEDKIDTSSANNDKDKEEQIIYETLRDSINKLQSASYDENGTYTAKTNKTDDDTTNSESDFIYYTVTDNNKETTLYIYVSWASLDSTTAKDLGHQGEEITLNYNAMLTNDAVQGTAETNDITYSFQNNPQTTDGNAYDPSGSTDDPTPTKVYTYGMELTKQFNGSEVAKFSNDNKPEAEKVTFQLKSKDGNTTYYFVKNSDGDYTLYNDDADMDTEKEGVTVYKSKTDSDTTTATQDINPDSNGTLKIKGLAAGTYQLVETATVDGYSVLTSPVYIKVEEDTNTTTGELTGKVTATIIESKDSSTIIQTLSNVAEATGDSETEKAKKNATFTITVNNSKNQFNLPLTGGLGLWIFTIAGGVIMAVAIIVISVGKSKKKSAK